MGATTAAEAASMRAVRFDSDAGKLTLESIARPSEPVGEEVLCTVVYAGVCGSDLHMITGDYKPTKPKVSQCQSLDKTEEVTSL